MKREEIITTIEKMQKHGYSDAQQAELTKIIESEARRRSAFADDLHRAIAYCFIHLSSTRYIPKQQRIFLRPTLRAVLLAVVIMLAVVFQMFVFIVILKLIGLGDYAFVIIIFALLFELGYVATKGDSMIRGHKSNQLGLSQVCTKCNYDLSGHESVLGEQLWVGPENCPECGQKYPAVF